MVISVTFNMSMSVHMDCRISTETFRNLDTVNMRMDSIEDGNQNM